MWGSAWNFFSIEIAHLRRVIGDHNNRLQRFSSNFQSDRQFNPIVRERLSRYVLDPENWAEKLSPLRGICLPLAICLNILLSVDAKPLGSIGKRDVSHLLPFLKFHHLLERKKTNELPSIPLKSFRELEKANSPIPPNLTQNHSKYLGLSLNLYRLVFTETQDREKYNIHIFPSRLSSHNDDDRYLQTDLIIDHPFIWKENKPNLLEKHRTPHDSPGHVLLITDLIKLLYTNNLKYQKNGARDCTALCRTCMALFSNLSEKNSHKTVCSSFPTGGKVTKRRAKNRIISNHLTTNPFNGKTEVNGLKFKRGDLNKLILPVCLSAFDIESMMKKPSAEVPHPSGADKIHTVFAYALAHCSLHDHLPLPPTLSRPRGCIFDPDHQSEEQFMLSFLLTLRNDAKPLSNFLKESLERDPGVPPFHSFSESTKCRWALSNRCIYCGNKFFSYRFKRSDDTPVRALSTFNKKFKIVRSKEKTIPCRHHIHLQLSSKLQA